MRCMSGMRQSMRLKAAAILLLVGSVAAYGEDTYNGIQLSIPSLAIGSATYSNVVVTPGSILAVQEGKANGSVDRYNPPNNQLTIPAVYYAGTTYTNVVITVGSLISIGNVAGVRTGQHLAKGYWVPRNIDLPPLARYRPSAKERSESNSDPRVTAVSVRSWPP